VGRRDLLGLLEPFQGAALLLVAAQRLQPAHGETELAPQVLELQAGGNVKPLLQVQECLLVLALDQEEQRLLELEGSAVPLPSVAGHEDAGCRVETGRGILRPSLIRMAASILRACPSARSSPCLLERSSSATRDRRASQRRPSMQ